MSYDTTEAPISERVLPAALERARAEARDRHLPYAGCLLYTSPSPRD